MSTARGGHARREERDRAPERRLPSIVTAAHSGGLLVERTAPRTHRAPGRVRRSYRILHITQSSAPGGIQRLLRELVPLQVEHGLMVGLAAPGSVGLNEALRAGGATVFDWSARRGASASLAAELRQLRHIIAAFEPDVVHLHSSKAGLIGRLAYRGPAVFQPQAWSFQHVPAPIKPLIVGWEWLSQFLVSVTVCSSLDEQREGQRLHIGRRSAVIENGIDLRRFPQLDARDRAQARRELGIPMGTPMVLCAARLCRQKGQDILLEAWEDVRRAVPEAVLFMVGSGPTEQRLKRADRPGVVWEPWQSDISRYLAACNVVAMPSRWEGMSFGLIEALASGRCVVATSATAMAENIVPYGAGAVAPLGVRTAFFLAREIIDRLEDPELADGEGANGRRRAEQLSIERMEARLYDVYEAIAARARRGS